MAPSTDSKKKKAADDPTAMNITSLFSLDFYPFPIFLFRNLSIPRWKSSLGPYMPTIPGPS